MDVYLMLFIISVVLAFLFAFFCGRPLKKCPYIFYAAAAVLTVIVACSDFRGASPFVRTYVLGLFTRGSFATGLWCVVMWTGAFPNGGKLMKTFMPVRGELSIFAAVLTLGHNIGFGKTYFVRLFTDAGKMTSNQICASVLTLIMLAVMLPLTVMSFPKVRKKFKASNWKKIQRTAYVFYACLYIHVLVLFMPSVKSGRDGYGLSIIAYSIVFLGYAVCRIRKAYLQSCRRNSTVYSLKTVNAVSTAAFAAAMVLPCLSLRTEAAETNIPLSDTQTNAAVTVSVTVSEGVQTVTESSERSVSTAVSAVTQVSGDVTTSESAVTEVSETSDVTETEQAEPEGENQNQEEQPQQEEQHEEPAPEPEIQYVYNNGTYTASAYGYDGDITVTITIENDVIVSISGSTSESDASYFNDASGYVFGQISGTVNPYVNAYGGCTYSSNGIMSAVAQALNQARR